MKARKLYSYTWTHFWLGVVVSFVVMLLLGIFVPPLQYSTTQRSALQDAGGAKMLAAFVPLVGPVAAHLAESFQGDPLDETASPEHPYGVLGDPSRALGAAWAYVVFFGFILHLLRWLHSRRIVRAALHEDQVRGTR